MAIQLDAIEAQLPSPVMKQLSALLQIMQA
jgi:hypothetical protein